MSKIKNLIKSSVGIVFVISSLLLARLSSFKHFYELLVIGLFIVFQVLLRNRIGKKTYFHLYYIFLIAGLIGDLVMGIWITKLWHYNYKHLYEYIVLYTVIYPIAGIVMVQSYLALKTLVLKVSDRGIRRPLISLQGYMSLICLMILVLATNCFAIISRPKPALFVTFYIFVTLTAFLLLSVASQIHKHKTVVEDLHKHPAKIMFVLIAVTYLNAFLHEIPNTYAKHGRIPTTH